MKTITYFLGGILFMTLISATTVSLMTIKPARPQSTVIKHFKSLYVDDVEDFVKQWVKKGYIVKSITLAETGGSTDCFVVLEKY